MHLNLVPTRPFPLRNFSHRLRGSVLVISLTSVAVLMLVGAITLSIVSRRLNATIQSTNWNSALAQTETGIALARTALMQSESNPTAAWALWTQKTDTASGTQYYERKVVDPADSSRTLLIQADKRTFNGRFWWRVRSTGSVGMSNRIALSDDSNDIALRRISFVRDWAPQRFFGQTAPALTRPTATRVVEALLEPVNPFSYALYARQNIDFEQITIDSYDTTSADASLRVPAYPPGSKNQMANIGTNATTGVVINSKPQGHIFGSVSTNGGSMLQWQTRASGEYRTDRYVELPSVTAVTFKGIPDTITAGKSITVRSTATSWDTAEEVRWNGNMVLNNSNKLTFKNNQGGTHVIVQVNGNMNVSSGTAALTIENGVKVKFVVNGDITLRDTAISLASNKSTDFRVYGMPLDPDPTIPPSSGKKVVKTAGRVAHLDGGTTVALYAPDHDVYVAKNNVVSVGAVVGRNIDFKGNPQTRFVYDEALAVDEPATDYRLVSWMEDIPMR